MLQTFNFSVISRDRLFMLTAMKEVEWMWLGENFRHKEEIRLSRARLLINFAKTAEIRRYRRLNSLAKRWRRESHYFRDNARRTRFLEPCMFAFRQKDVSAASPIAAF